MNIFSQTINRPGLKLSGSLAMALTACLLILNPSISHADDVTLYYGTGVDSNLLDVLPKTVSGELVWERSHLLALGYFNKLTTPVILQSALDLMGATSTTTGVEAIVVKHSGMQDNYELDTSYNLRSGEFNLAGDYYMKLGFGLGFSYAFGEPTYEDGPIDNPKRRYRFQNYNSYELEFGSETSRDMALILRIHHRSGIYGIIAPPHVGSNFITTGLRYTFN